MHGKKSHDYIITLGEEKLSWTNKNSCAGQRENFSIVLYFTLNCIYKIPCMFFCMRVRVRVRVRVCVSLRTAV